MIGDDVLGCNIFAYCGNNPIVRADVSGHFWGTVLVVTALVAVVTYAIVKTVAAVQETKRVSKEIQSLPKPTKDITDQLNQTMHNNAKYLYDYQKKNGLVKTEIEFKNKVKTGGDWDLKKNIDKTETFNYNGLILQAQDIGNLHYGYVGASMGFTSDTLLKMAGLVQTNRTWQMYFISNGDDLRDQIYIQYGIQLFNEGK